MESKLYYFAGEAACGRWAIAQNKRFVWGKYFYWLCDCAVIKEIFDYSGCIAMTCGWAQELLGYQFAVVHRPNKNMKDVDALSRNHYPLVSLHLKIVACLHMHDTEKRPLAYARDYLEEHTSCRKLKKKATAPNPVAVLITSFIDALAIASIASKNCGPVCSDGLVLDSVPLLLMVASTTPTDVTIDALSNADEAVLTNTSTWLCVDDIIGSSFSLFQSAWICSTFWNLHVEFTNEDTCSLFYHMFNPNTANIVNTTTMHETIQDINEVSIAEVTHHHYGDYSFPQWVEHCARFMANVIQLSPALQVGLLWTREAHLPTSFWSHCQDIMMTYLPSN